MVTARLGRCARPALPLPVLASGPARRSTVLSQLEEGEVRAEEEGFENLSAMASTFIVLFLLSLFYSTTVTLFKVAGGPRWGRAVAAWLAPMHTLSASRR
ncbi:hypothetical protein J0S82_016986 [Galemys pyrenaicus]|uniref:Uncharacterized protein n=1 Tax=Galemys pyrenaicus TaxID=202257 RepID=A0A8J6ACW8_GALPY|nr:hypothetical protein J0S82_016986 [Galemys pyrenaicus]